MACIYETINIIHKEKGINPYRYIGSDQNNKNWYLGSSRSLKDDIKKYGKENFIKQIIIDFNFEITNINLREIEKNILTELDCAHDITYYNKTNSSLKGYVLTKEERLQKSNQLRKAWKKWRENLSKDDEYYIQNNKRFSNLSKEVLTEEYWIEKYGEEEGRQNFLTFMKNKSTSKIGEKNGMCRYSDESKKLAINLFKQGISRIEICKKTGISYGIIKLIIRNYKKYNVILTKNKL